MNVYPCWYRGTLGYGCRTGGRKWMFVPELGETDGNIYKNLKLEQLVFRNPLEKKYELQRDENPDSTAILNIFRSMFVSSAGSQNIAGELLSRF